MTEALTLRRGELEPDLCGHYPEFLFRRLDVVRRGLLGNSPKYWLNANRAAGCNSANPRLEGKAFRGRSVHDTGIAIRRPVDN
jgi:hypothetical protein